MFVAQKEQLWTKKEFLPIKLLPSRKTRYFDSIPLTRRLCFRINNIYMKKLLNSDWLRAMQFKYISVQRV